MQTRDRHVGTDTATPARDRQPDKSGRDPAAQL